MSSRPIKARLELGVQEEGKPKKKRSSPAQPRGARLVNYSEFRTKLDDPFSAQVKINNEGPSNKESKENIKAPGLKDLPL